MMRESKLNSSFSCRLGSLSIRYFASFPARPLPLSMSTTSHNNLPRGHPFLHFPAAMSAEFYCIGSTVLGLGSAGQRASVTSPSSTCSKSFGNTPPLTARTSRQGGRTTGLSDPPSFARRGRKHRGRRRVGEMYVRRYPLFRAHATTSLNARPLPEIHHQPLESQ